MGDKKNLVRVRIGNEEYTLRSDRTDEYTRDVAAHVDHAISEVKSSGSVIEAHKVAVLAALAIADELFQIRAAGTETTQRIVDMTAELSRLLPPAKRA
ncbi:MAG: cell division protein ZapA [Gemmatimonadales bacterium]